MDTKTVVKSILLGKIDDGTMAAVMDLIDKHESGKQKVAKTKKKDVAPSKTSGRSGPAIFGKAAWAAAEAKVKKRDMLASRAYRCVGRIPRGLLTEEEVAEYACRKLGHSYIGKEAIDFINEIIAEDELYRGDTYDYYDDYYGDDYWEESCYEDWSSVAEDVEWNPADHPRGGNPDNKGEFSKAWGGSGCGSSYKDEAWEKEFWAKVGAEQLAKKQKSKQPIDISKELDLNSKTYENELKMICNTKIAEFQKRNPDKDYMQKGASDFTDYLIFLNKLELQGSEINGLEITNKMNHSEAFDGVNPDYKEKSPTANNCFICVYAYLCRRYGLDVKAKPFDEHDTNQAECARNPAKMFIDSKGASPYAPQIVMRNIHGTKKRAIEIRKLMRQNKIYALSLRYRGREHGHILLVTKHDSTLYFLDPQTHEVYDENSGGAYIMLNDKLIVEGENSPELFEIDDCMPNPQYLEMLENY